MLTEQQIAQIAESVRKESGGEQEEIQNLLKRTYTVGQLKKALAKIDDSLPVELEVVVEVTEEGHCTTQPGLLIHSYQTTEGDDGYPRFSLIGAQPQNSEAFAEAFEIDSKLN